MSNPAPQNQLNTPAEKLQALQYLLNVAEQAPVPLAVHNQTKTYAQALFNLLVLGSPQAAAPVATPSPVEPPVTTVAEAVAAAQEPKPRKRAKTATEVPAPAAE